MARLGPFAARPRLAVAVSGGADSMALVLLAAAWACARGGDVLALVVDHRLRPESGHEAAITLGRLAAAGVAGRGLALNLAPGPGLAARARDARLAALGDACAAAGLTDLLLGHHAGDVAETLLMRALGGSSMAGFAGIAAQRETARLRLLRPLLGVAPARLRATVAAAGVDWVVDPSNADRRALRGRLRALRGSGGSQALTAAATAAGARRAAEEARIGDILARRVTLFPEGFAILAPGAVPPAALAALLRTIAGAAYPIPSWRVADLAAAPRPATIAGVRFLAAGRAGQGLLVVREAQAMAEPVPAETAAVWDRRFRLDSAPLPGATLGALGPDAAKWQRHPRLPAAVLWTLPAVRRDGQLAAVPHLEANAAGPRLSFCPPHPAAGAPWLFLPPTENFIADAS